MKELTLRNFEHLVFNEKGAKLIKFYSKTCPLCINLKELLAPLQEKFNRVTYYSVDIDREKELAQLFIKDGVPTLYYVDSSGIEEVPYPYSNPSKKTGYRKKDLVSFLRSKEHNEQTRKKD